MASVKTENTYNKTIATFGNKWFTKKEWVNKVKDAETCTFDTMRRNYPIERKETYVYDYSIDCKTAAQELEEFFNNESYNDGNVSYEVRFNKKTANFDIYCSAVMYRY